MMYISVFPIAISLRRTNVYEEKSLGIYSSSDDETGGGTSSYIGTHLRRQLSFDLWYVFLGFFFISIIEGARLRNSKDVSFTLFSTQDREIWLDILVEQSNEALSYFVAHDILKFSSPSFVRLRSILRLCFCSQRVVLYHEEGRNAAVVVCRSAAHLTHTN